MLVPVEDEELLPVIFGPAVMVMGIYAEVKSDPVYVVVVVPGLTAAAPPIDSTQTAEVVPAIEQVS